MAPRMKRNTRRVSNRPPISYPSGRISPAKSRNRRRNRSYTRTPASIQWFPRSMRQEAKPPKKEAAVDPNIRSLEQDLSDKLGARVHLQSGSKGKGKLVISYNSLDELEGILEHIR